MRPRCSLAGRLLVADELNCAVIVPCRKADALHRGCGRCPHAGAETAARNVGGPPPAPSPSPAPHSSDCHTQPLQPCTLHAWAVRGVPWTFELFDAGRSLLLRTPGVRRHRRLLAVASTPLNQRAPLTMLLDSQSPRLLIPHARDAARSLHCTPYTRTLRLLPPLSRRAVPCRVTACSTRACYKTVIQAIWGARGLTGRSQGLRGRLRYQSIGSQWPAPPSPQGLLARQFLRPPVALVASVCATEGGSAAPPSHHVAPTPTSARVRAL